MPRARDFYRYFRQKHCDEVLATARCPPAKGAQLRVLTAESAHRIPRVASFILLADIGDQRIFRVNDNVSRFALRFKADRKLHLCSPAFQHSKDSTIQLADVK